MQNSMSVRFGALATAWLTYAICNVLALNAQRSFAFVVSPNPALMDERVTIRVVGLPPNRTIVIRARSKDQSDRLWRSSAVFLARQDGSIDLSEQAAIAGTYAGVDAMGLFWSMQPDMSERALPAFFSVTDPSKPIITEIEVVSGDRVFGTTLLARRFAAAGVRSEPFKIDGVVGILYRPGDDRKHRAVILLGGSEGGFPTREAAMLASRGFVTLALAYFGTHDLPATLQRIPIEYFGKAIHCLQKLPILESETVTVFGASRGAEAALIAGSVYPEINGVIGVSSSHVRWEGATAKALPGGPAWTFERKPLPYVAFHISPAFAFRFLWNTVTRSAIPLNSMFVDSLRRGENDAVQIAVERIGGPVLLASGADDQLWPSALMSARAIERLRRYHHPYLDEHVCYEGAGHWLPSAYVPTAGLRAGTASEIGGTPEATARVQAQWWPKVLRFLAAIPSQKGTR